MRVILAVFVLLNLYNHHVYSASLPGPLVYVVTPSSRPPQIDMGRSAPFYYHNWMKRMDTPDNAAPPTSTTTTEKSKTPDLIFAEFETDNSNMKSIRNLLEQEKIKPRTTTTSTTTPTPIYVPDEDTSASDSNYGLPRPTTTEKPKTKADMTDYFALYNNLYNSGPVYVPSAPSSSSSTTSEPTSTTTTTTTEAPAHNVENIWHIIDNEKHEHYSGKWEEVSTSDEQSNKHDSGESNNENDNNSNENQTEDEAPIDENFAVPGFGTNPGNGGENESRAIRTESNYRFPYINLKPFKMKNSNTKKVNNMFNLDSFTEIKNPVRGEVQDTQMVPVRQPIGRYNPAQPYLPDYGVGTKSKPSAPAPVAPPAPPPRPPPVKAIANLVPPPPPPAPKLTADDFPSPSTYESFPPYAPAGPGVGSSFSSPPVADSGSDSSDSSDDDSPPPPPSYRYKPPVPAAPPAVSFVPTLPPLSKPFSGYSYNKPPMAPMAQDNGPSDMDSPPSMGSPPDMDSKPDFQGYHYNKPAPPQPQDDGPPAGYQPESDYPDLIFDNKHHGHGMPGGNDMKANDMGMMPPPPSYDAKPDAAAPPMDDHGFPHDFPGDFKYAHDFDEHDYDHHHHHHHHPTTTTTETPRVNRYSYYYLGKKLYYLPLYFSVYFVVYVGALIIKAVLRHKITYPNSFRPNDTTATFFSKRSVEEHLSNENLHEITGRVTKAIASAAEKYMSDKRKDQ